jgi:hypothetical protein
MQYSHAVINPSKFEGWSSSVEEAKTFKKQLDDKIKDAKMLLRHLTNQTPITIHEKKTSKSSKKLSSLKIYNNE